MSATLRLADVAIPNSSAHPALCSSGLSTIRDSLPVNRLKSPLGTAGKALSR